MSMSSRLKAVIACKGFSTNIKNEHFIYDYIYLSNYLWAPENGGGGGGAVDKMDVIP